MYFASDNCPKTMSDFRIIAATENDVPLILSLIRELADYEKLLREVTATEETLRESLFGARPAAEALLGYEGDTPVGYAIFFHNFSTFLGQRGLYLEDLYVRPPARGRGYGLAFLRYLAQLAIERNCARLEWSVLDWNEPAIGFYKSLGAAPMNEWTVFRLMGDALHTLAQ
jgi:GNAT superfamily N-acetyltransferase